MERNEFFLLLLLLGIFVVLFFFGVLSNAVKAHEQNKRSGSEVLPPFYLIVHQAITIMITAVSMGMGEEARR